MKYPEKGMWWPTPATTLGACLSLKQFEGVDFAGTPLGKLFLALIAETAWSSEYSVIINVHRGPELIINHPHFPAKLVIWDSNWTDWSVRRVEDAVREHLGKQMGAVRAKVEPLQGQISAMDDALRRIDKAKARAALLAAFPDVGELTLFSPDPADVYAFGTVMDHTPAYLVRMVNHEAVGVACLSDQSPLGWHVLSDGIAKHQRLGDFWIALAKSFAARELGIPEVDLTRCDEICVTEKPWAPKQDKYVVNKVVLRTFDDRKIVVTFGVDNLPASVDLVPTNVDDVVVIRDMRV